MMDSGTLKSDDQLRLEASVRYWHNRTIEAEKLLKESLNFIGDCYVDEIEFRARVKEFLGDDEK
jgi:hypothetical protein